MRNNEGYQGRTAEAAIANVARQQKRKQKEVNNAYKRQTEIKKSNKN